TTFAMDPGMDTGDVLLARPTTIGADETAGELSARLARLGAEVSVETLDRLATMTPTPQDHAAATLAPRFKKGDGAIDWRLAARVLERVETDAAFADLALEAETTRRPVAARDIGLATELIYGTLRWQRYLDWILAPHSRRRLDALDARVRVLLRMTAYQLVFLERVPAFA